MVEVFEKLTKKQLINLVIALAADKGIDLATGGRLNKLTKKVIIGIGKRLLPTAGRVGASVGTAVGRSAIGAARPLLANPYVAGAALGYGALQTPQGQDLLEWAEEKGKRDRVAYEQYKTDVAMRMREFADDPIGYSQDVIASRPGESYGPYGLLRPITGKILPEKTKSRYNKAMSAALKAVKRSSKGGKKGTISPAKSVFKTVSKVVSKVNKGAKVPNKGIAGIAAKAARRILGKKKKTTKKTKKRGATYTYRK